jgi:hypothetical protein
MPSIEPPIISGSRPRGIATGRNAHAGLPASFQADSASWFSAACLAA